MLDTSMNTRLEMIGQIRDAIELLSDRGCFAQVKEIIGKYDRHNFSGVPSAEILRIWIKLTYLAEMPAL
jgi:hypothetical protein